MVDAVPRLEGAPDIAEKLVGLSSGQDLVKRLTQQLLGWPVQERGVRRRNLEVASLGVEHEYGVGYRLEKCPQFSF
jgi:hypothetical protein